jgi:capsule polysaccharide export protein KpsC/LpsZ
MQPEASTCPKAGAFTDQERIIELLAFHLPAQVKLYVKEHPNQGELLRNCAFYQRLLDIPQVQFVPKNFSTFTLIENAKAIATCTGTAGFESLFRAKPVLMFGHRFYQYARGVYCIHSSQDCKEALKKILENGEVPTIRDARLFLKSVQDTAAETYVGYPESKYSIKQQANIMGEYIREKMRMYGIHL